MVRLGRGLGGRILAMVLVGTGSGGRAPMLVLNSLERERQGQAEQEGKSWQKPPAP